MLVPASLLLSSCGALPYDTDGLDRLDRIEVRAGDAQQRNITLLTLDPIPGNHAVALAPADGKRIMAVMEDYYDWSPAPTEGTEGATIEMVPAEEGDAEGDES